MCLRRLWDILATQASGIYHQRSTRYEVDGRFQVAKLSNPLDLTRRTLARGTGDLRGEPAQVSWGVQRERAEFVHVRRLSSCWMLRSILFPDATTHLTKPIRLCIMGLDIIAREGHEREQVLRQLLGQLLELLVRILIPAPLCHVVACKRAPVGASPWRRKRLRCCIFWQFTGKYCHCISLLSKIECRGKSQHTRAHHYRLCWWHDWNHGPCLSARCLGCT